MEEENFHLQQGLAFLNNEVLVCLEIVATYRVRRAKGGWYGCGDARHHP